jgi:DNA-binding CsgD family transcriptional regulator
MFEESLVLFRELGDKWNLADTLYFSALAASFRVDQTDTAAARSMVEESLAISRELGDQRGLAYSLNLLGFVSLLQGEGSAACPLMEESLAIHKALGNRQGIAYTSLTFGWFSLSQGDYVAARTRYEKSLAVMIELDDRWFIAACLEGLAITAAQTSTGESLMSALWAARLWGTAEALREAISVPLRSFERAINEWGIAKVRSQLGEEAFAAAWAEGRTMTPAEVSLLSPDSAAQERAVETVGASRADTPSKLAQPTSTVTSLPNPPAGLTGREVEVLRLLAMGLTNAQIAERLVISLLTVKAHVRSIYSKLDIASRSAATRYAIEHKLV